VIERPTLLAWGLTLLSVGSIVAPRADAGVFSELWGFAKQYRVGVDFAGGGDSATLNFEADTSQTNGSSSCIADPSTGYVTSKCSVQIAAGGRGGFGLFAERAFKRQGNFYFNMDLGFGIRSLEGRFNEDIETRKTPLRDVKFFLYGGVIKPYIIFGLTPARVWPDLLISLGPVAQVLAGRVHVNDESAQRVLAQTSFRRLNAFLQLELVFVRFGDGYFSLFASRTAASSEETIGDFYPDEVDGMRDIQAEFNNNLLGFKLLFNFPKS